MTTGEKIKMLRISKGMTQEELGKKVGVQRAAINKYEKGTVVNIKRSTLEKLASALNISPADLLDDNATLYDLGDGELVFDSQITPVEEELIRKIKQLKVGHQHILMSVVDALLQEERNNG